MSDTYQAVFDAVRSKISNGDVGVAVESAVRGLGIDVCVFQITQSVQAAAREVPVADRGGMSGRSLLEVRAEEWWASKRPVGWSVAKHIAHPVINLSTDSEQALAIEVAWMVSRAAKKDAQRHAPLAHAKWCDDLRQRGRNL
jgi:hypothetical protein